MWCCYNCLPGLYRIVVRAAINFNEGNDSNKLVIIFKVAGHYLLQDMRLSIVGLLVETYMIGLWELK